MAKSATSHLKIIQTLLDEHTAIKDALLILHHMSRQVEKKRKVNSKDLFYLTTFFQQFADAIHHHAEEDVLFRAIQHNRTLRSMSQKLMTQHTMGRIFLGEMTDAIRAAESGRRGWRKRFVDSATAYHTLLTIHICDEDHIFFPKAERSLICMSRVRLRSENNEQVRTKLLRRLHQLHRQYVPISKDCISCSDAECSRAGWN